MIDPKTFKVENELQIPGECGVTFIVSYIAIPVDDSLGSQSLFITGDKLGQVRATKEVCVCIHCTLSVHLHHTVSLCMKHLIHTNYFYITYHHFSFLMIYE